MVKGRIIKQTLEDGSHRYDFQFENKRGYKTTVEGLSEKFNPEYWNYAKLISGVLRYRMPIENVIKLVGSLQLKSESINTWKIGVERALKKYIVDGTKAKGRCAPCADKRRWFIKKAASSAPIVAPRAADNETYNKKISGKGGYTLAAPFSFFCFNVYAIGVIYSIR